jgi:hypothetical protein
MPQKSYTSKGYTIQMRMPFPDLSITQRSIQPMSKTLLTLAYPPKVIVGKALQHYGVIITRRSQARMDKTAI